MVDKLPFFDQLNSEEETDFVDDFEDSDTITTFPKSNLKVSTLISTDVDSVTTTRPLPSNALSTAANPSVAMSSTNASVSSTTSRTITSNSTMASSLTTNTSSLLQESTTLQQAPFVPSSSPSPIYNPVDAAHSEDAYEDEAKKKVDVLESGYMDEKKAGEKEANLSKDEFSLVPRSVDGTVSSKVDSDLVRRLGLHENRTLIAAPGQSGVSVNKSKILSAIVPGPNLNKTSSTNATNQNDSSNVASSGSSFLLCLPALAWTVLISFFASRLSKM